MSGRVDVPVRPHPATTYREMFAAEFGYVCRTLRRLGVRPRDLEDAAQDTFMAVHAKWLSYDPALPIRPWLFGFALRVAANYRRRRAVEHDELSSELRADDANPEDAAAETEARTLALDALEKLDPDRRDVFVMHDLEGFGAPTIAEMLAIPTNTVYSRLRTARAEFEAAVARARLTRRSKP